MLRASGTFLLLLPSSEQYMATLDLATTGGIELQAGFEDIEQLRGLLETP
jgi:hypothetical protein